MKIASIGALFIYILAAGASSVVFASENGNKNSSSQQFSMDVLTFLIDTNMKVTAGVNCNVSLRIATNKAQKRKILKRPGCKAVRKALGADYYDSK
jgi:hypothetical protein